MTLIETVAEDTADDAVAVLYAGARESMGFVPNSLRAFSLRPEVYAAWEQLKSAIAGGMDARRYELATLAAARKLRSSYCCLAHGKVLAELFLDPGAVRELALGSSLADLDEADVAVMSFAEKVVGDASSITEAEIQALRDVGLSDRDIFDVVAAAAARCFFSKTLDAVGAEPDAGSNSAEPPA